MNNEATNKVSKIINTLKDDEAKDEVDSVAITDPTLDMRNNILNFFNSRITAIESQEKLKLLVQSKLTEKLETEELTVAQLKDLFVVLSRETINASTDIMGMVQPSEALTKQSSDDRALGDLPADTQRKLDLLYRLLSKGEIIPES